MTIRIPGHTLHQIPREPQLLTFRHQRTWQRQEDYARKSSGGGWAIRPTSPGAFCLLFGTEGLLKLPFYTGAGGKLIVPVTPTQV